MPLRRNWTNANLALAAVPPSLPPSVEEAYRRKCIQLRNRTNEVEDANDGARLRLARIKRQVEKLRIERAFLLEQLAKRTSTNVEDSEGSPSPPPTANFSDNLKESSANLRKPKDKPLRIKKGHRKSAAPGDPESKANASAAPPSPASETNSHAPNNDRAKGAQANGVRKKSKEPSPFRLYCEETRPTLDAKSKDSDLDIDQELARGWKELTEAERDEFQAKADSLSKSRADKAAAAADVEDDSPRKDSKSEPEADKPETQDDDIEMANYDTEDQETQLEKDGDD